MKYWGWLLLCGCWGSAQALEVSGFATLGAAAFSSTDADFAYNNHSVGPGRSRPVDAGLDSNLGVQLSGALTDRWRANAQAIAYRGASGEVGAELTLANVELVREQGWSVRLGRVQNPNFLYSDVRHVHGVLPWVRPPREVYGVTTFFNYDGVQALWRGHVAGWGLTLQTGLAQAQMDYSRDAGVHVDSASARQMGYAAIKASQGPWTVKLSYERGRLTAISPLTQPLFDAMRVGGQAPLANALALQDKEYDFWALGGRYDGSQWLVLAEVAQRGLDAYFGQHGGAYVTLGYRLGRVMPYATLARTWTLTDRAGATAGSFAPLVQGLYDGIRYNASSASAGLALEVSEHWTLKLQADVIRPDAGSHWVYENYGPGYDHARPDTDALLSVVLNGVF